MNKRIQQLADEAAKFSAIMALPTGKSGDKLFVEKFAELIIKECAGIAQTYMSRWPEDTKLTKQIMELTHEPTNSRTQESN